MRYLSLLVLAVGLLSSSLSSAAEEASVESLAAAVANPDQAAAVAAIDALDKLEAGAKPAVPALIAALGRDDEEIRWHAARTLGAIGPEAAEAVPALMKLLDDSAAKVQAYAAFALGEIGEASLPAADKLVERAFHADPVVRRAAVGALRDIKPPFEISAPAFVKMLEEGDPSLILPALHTFAEEGEKSLPRLREALKHEKLAYWACLVLAELDEKAAPAVPELTALLEHAEPEVRLQALITLGQIGAAAAPAIPAIVKILESDAFDPARCAAAYALGGINQKDDAATAALVAAARGDKPMLRMTSLWALARQNPDRADVVAHAAKSLAAGLTSEDAQARAVAAKALGEFGDHADVVGPALVESLKDADETVKRHALDALAALGPKILPRVVVALKDPERRHFAIRLVYRLGPAAAPALPALIEALNTPAQNESDLQFRREVQFALAGFGADAKDAIPALLESLASDDREVRGTACLALGKMGPAAAVALPKLRERLQEMDDSDKTAFVWALLKIKPGDEPLAVLAVPLLTRALGHPEEAVRMEAAAALGEIGRPAARPPVIERLKTLLNDESEQVRDAAAATLEKFGA